jgi:hypothetical protein
VWYCQQRGGVGEARHNEDGSLLIMLGRRAKRYERLMKANEINPNAGRDHRAGCPSSSSPNPNASDEEDTISKPPAKRRKTDHSMLRRKHEDRKAEPEPEPETQAETSDTADCTA